MTDHGTDAAFADPATVRAWRRERRRSRTNLILWIFSLLGSVVIVAILRDWVGNFVATTILVLLVTVTAVGIGFVSLRWEHLSQMRDVLRAYPWQNHPPLGKAHPAGIEYFHLPDPDGTQKSIKVAFRRYGLGKNWQRAVMDSRSAGFRFAGDPRYACVVALPGYRKLLAVRPQHPHLNSDGTRPERVTEASWQRAQEAGINVAPSLQEQRRKLVYSMWKSIRNNRSTP
ncbi:hypothetical protein [Streptomyces sp. NPDC002520]